MSPTSDDVRRELDRLLASAVFANAGRMSRFLKFIVEQTLSGEAERLKEYVIGIEVFDRDADYDPRVDSIVRVEAARLRAKLAEYYAGDGRGDAIVLTLPKGGYAPLIKVARQADAVDGAAATKGSAPLATSVDAAPASQSRARAAWRPWAVGVLLAAAVTVAVVAWAPRMTNVPAVRLAVLPLTPDASDVSGAELAQQLTEGVTAALVRDGRFDVVASSAARAEYSPGRRPRDIAATLDADLLVEGRVTLDGERIRIEARAANGRTEAKLWVHDFAGDRANPEAIEREVAATIAQALATTEIDRER